MSNSHAIHAEPLRLTRELKAPRQLVFEAWTQPEHLQNWMFPKQGFACEYVSVDIRAGGSSLHKMTTPSGYEMWLLTQYEVVSPPDRLVFRQYSSNTAGEIVPNTQIPNWPPEIRATVTLEEVGDKTKLAFIWEPINPTAEEAEAFEAARDQHGQGWGGGLNRLELYLGNVSKQ